MSATSTAHIAIAVIVGLLVIVVAAPIIGRPTARPIDGPTIRSGRRLPTIRLPRRSSSAIRPAPIAAWCDDLARSIRHGTSLAVALATVDPADAAIASHTEPLHHWLGRGATVGDACDEWSDHLDAIDAPRAELLATVSAVLAATAVLGGSVAAPLDRLATAMRQRAAADLERDAQSAQAQMSARVMTIVPVAMLALLLAVDADVRTAVTQPSGAAVVSAGLALNAVGAWWMRLIVGGRR